MKKYAVITMDVEDLYPVCAKGKVGLWMGRPQRSLRRRRVHEA